MLKKLQSLLNPFYEPENLERLEAERQKCLKAITTHTMNIVYEQKMLEYYKAQLSNVGELQEFHKTQESAYENTKITTAATDKFSVTGTHEIRNS